MIPSETVERILAQTDLVEIIGGHLPLKQTGRTYKALCPFHAEKTPSFTVNPERQIFHCFGCGEGGDAISFLMKHERLTFPEAVRMLASRAGIPISAKGGREAGGGPREGEGRLQLIEAHRAALEFFRRALGEAGGAPAREYLAARGVGDDLVERFQLGYAPGEWDGLLRALRRAGYPEAVLERAGLVVRRQNGTGHYDRFRHRLMIPIWDVSGKVIAFGGRALGPPGADEAKYLNSPETPLYRKGTHLYGLNLAARAIREQGWAIVVEGYFDLIALHRFGFGNAVASLGTSLTADQVTLLRRYADRVVLAFDPDRAGVQAALRGIELLVAQGLGVEVAVLPEGTDPDSLLRERGAGAFQEAVAGALDVVDFAWAAATRGSGRGIDGQARVAQALLPILARMEQGVRRAKYLQKLAERLGVPEAAVLEDMRRLRVGRETRSGPAPASSPATGTFPAAEKDLVRLLLLRPDLVSHLPADFAEDHLTHPTLRRMYGAIVGGPPEGRAALVRAMSHNPDQDVRSLVSAFLAAEEAEFEDPEAMLRDYVLRIEGAVAARRARAISEKGRAIEKAEGYPSAREIFEEHPSVKRETP